MHVPLTGATTEAITRSNFSTRILTLRDPHPSSLQTTVDYATNRSSP